jgi:hypothetical protein
LSVEKKRSKRAITETNKTTDQLTDEERTIEAFFETHFAMQNMHGAGDAEKRMNKAGRLTSCDRRLP